MNVPDSTLSLLAAQQYIQNILTLNEKGFIDSLSEDVVYIHFRLKDGSLADPVLLFGKREVSEDYQKHFFGITHKIEILDTHYLGAELAALIDCEAREEEHPGDFSYSYHLTRRIQLMFMKDPTGALKVSWIFEGSMKRLLE